MPGNKKNKSIEDFLLNESKETLPQNYIKLVKRRMPDIHDDLIKIAKYAIKSFKRGKKPSDVSKNLSSILKSEPDADPRTSGDTYGIKLYIDYLLDDLEDKKVVGQIKRWYQTALEQMIDNEFDKKKKKKKKKIRENINENVIHEYVKSILKEEVETKKEVRMSFDAKLPKDILSVSKIFKAAGYELYVVGGAVRDMLLGKEPKDYDLTTNATPDEILELLSHFPKIKTLEIGKAFGVINLVMPNGNEYEVATFREDFGSGRRPDYVKFTTIENDVKRRDLSINALFYDIDKKEIVDYVGGIEDLKNGIVKAVGNPEERFAEDRLRILRALRFAARLGNDLEDETAKAIEKDNSLIGISGERIKDEFFKSIMSAKSTKNLFRMYDKFNLWEQVLPGLKINKNYIEESEPVFQVALLTIDNDSRILSKKLNDLKYSNEEIKKIVFLNLLQTLSPETAYNLKKLWKSSRLSQEDLEHFAKMSNSVEQKLVDAFNKFDLSVKGEDLMKLGFKGRELGKEIHRQETEKFKDLL